MVGHGAAFLLAVGTGAESGRGLVLVDAVGGPLGVAAAMPLAGVLLPADTKRVWCELVAGLTSLNGHNGGPHVAVMAM